MKSKVVDAGLAGLFGLTAAFLVMSTPSPRSIDPVDDCITDAAQHLPPHVPVSVACPGF